MFFPDSSMDFDENEAFIGFKNVRRSLVKTITIGGKLEKIMWPDQPVLYRLLNYKNGELHVPLWKKPNTNKVIGVVVLFFFARNELIEKCDLQFRFGCVIAEIVFFFVALIYSRLFRRLIIFFVSGLIRAAAVT